MTVRPERPEPVTKHVFESITETPSLTTPAVRMVVVAAGYTPPDGDYPGDVWHSVHPVLAIQAAIMHHFARVDRGEFRRAPRTLAEFERDDHNPWMLEASGPEYTPIVLPEDSGLLAAHEAFGGRYTMWEAFVAPWTPEEDETRLELKIARLKNSLRYLHDCDDQV